MFLWTEHVTDTAQTQAQRAVTHVAPRIVVIAHIRNSSQQPVYDLEVTWHHGAAMRGSAEGKGTMLPDAQVDVRRELNSGPSSAVSGSPIRVTLTFRDAAGVRWQVDEDGRLEENAN